MCNGKGHKMLTDSECHAEVYLTRTVHVVSSSLEKACGLRLSLDGKNSMAAPGARW